MTILSDVTGWVRSKARLVIEYVLIAALVALAGVTLSEYLQRRQLVTTVTDLSIKLTGVSASLTQQVDTNKAQDVAIAEINRIRALDGQAITGLQQQLGEAQAKDQSIRAKLAQLERNNAAAKSLLDTAVPHQLGCVLDGTDCPDGNHADGH